MVATGQEIVREKNILQGQRKSGNFTSSQGNLSLGKKSGKSEILRVRNYSFSSTFVVF